MSKLKVLITGAAGQVGSHVAELMLARGDTVLGLDDFTTGRPEHLPLESANYAFREGSIADAEIVNRAFGEFLPDVVVHTAAAVLRRHYLKAAAVLALWAFALAFQVDAALSTQADP